MPTGHHFLATDLHQFTVSLFTHLGSTSGGAALVADHLIAANLAGHDSHDVGMIPSYMRSHTDGFLQLNRHTTVAKDTGAVITPNGSADLGQVVTHEAIQLGIERTRQHGMATIAPRNTHHVGYIGYWAERCAAAELISIHFVSVIGNPMVAPFREKSSRFGTNPLCVVFPRAGHPPLLPDYATNIIAFGKTRVAQHRGEAVAPGCLIDATGRLTTDPAVMQTSPLDVLLAFAQHRGYALATLCEVLGDTLSGGQTTRQENPQTSVDAISNCMTAAILRPDAFDAPNSQTQTEVFIAWCKQSPHDADAPVLAPGEWGAANREARLAQGTPLNTGNWQAVCTAARDIGLSESYFNRCRPLAWLHLPPQSI